MRPHKASKKWFSALHPSQAHDLPPVFLRRLRALEARFNDDAGWAQWWTGSPYAKLIVSPGPSQAVDGVVVDSRGSTYLVLQPSPELRRLVGRPGPEDEEAIGDAWERAVLVGVDNVGKILGLGAGPGREIDFDRAPEPRVMTLQELDAARTGSGHDRQEGNHPATQEARSDETTTTFRAHPRFRQHFTHRIYDPADVRNDETLPFGSDDGSDETSEWEERAAEVTVDTTLRMMLGDQADEVARSRIPEDGELLITTGFNLLRLSGQIDREGHRWLSAALRRRRYDGREFKQMLSDLRAFRPAEV